MGGKLSTEEEEEKKEKKKKKKEKKKKKKERKIKTSEPNEGESSRRGEKRYDPGDPTLQFVEEEDVLDFLCVGYESLRAKMSCGHAVTPTSLTEHCRRLLDEEGQCRFECGKCDREWSFEEVSKMALLTPEEVKEFERKIFIIAARDLLDVKKCPGCKSRVVRNDLNDLCVECRECTAREGRTYMFCWQCLKKWKGSDYCDNDGCQSQLEILKTCDDIVLSSVTDVTGRPLICPSTRACPTCGMLVVHDGTGCKNIVCRQCKVEFCSVCLNITTECLKLNPQSWFKVCSSGVAPRQTSIPVRQIN